MSPAPDDRVDVDWLDVDFSDAQLEKIIANVAAAEALAPVVDLESRRRPVPRIMAAVAAAVVMIFVLGAVGAPRTVPALDELVARHSAAAGVGAELPMAVALEMAPKVPDELQLVKAYDDGKVAQLIFQGDDGQAVSAFMQKGEVDFDRLPAGHMVDSGDTEMWSGEMSGSEIAVVDGDNVVWTFISGSKEDTMMVATSDELPSQPLSVLERIRSWLSHLPHL